MVVGPGSGPSPGKSQGAVATVVELPVSGDEQNVFELVAGKPVLNVTVPPGAPN